MTDTTNIQQGGVKPFWMIAFAIIGFILVITSLFFGAYHIIKKTDPSGERSALFSISLFSKKETLVLKPEKRRVSGDEEIGLSVVHRNKKEPGFYTLSFECDSDVRIRVDSEEVLCDDAFVFEDTTTSLKVSAVDAKTRYRDLPISLTFTPESGEALSSSSVMLTLVNTSAVAQSESGETSDTDKVAPPVENMAVEAEKNAPAVASAQEIASSNKAKSPEPARVVFVSTSAQSTQIASTASFAEKRNTSTSKTLPRNANISLKTSKTTSHARRTSEDANLIIDAKDVGIITDNGFYRTQYVTQYDRAAIVFTVTNTGRRTSGSWSFEAELPTKNREVYRSNIQDSLAPGESVELTLSFNTIRGGRGGDAEVFVLLKSRDAERDGTLTTYFIVD